MIDVVSFGAAGKSIQLGVKTLRASRALKTVKEPKMTIRGNRTRKAVSILVEADSDVAAHSRSFDTPLTYVGVLGGGNTITRE